MMNSNRTMRKEEKWIWPVAVFAAVMLSLACAPGSHIPDRESPNALVYQQQCGGCHALPHPKRNTYPQWVHLVEVMDRARVDRDVRPLTSAERTQILAYLEAHAR
jgi:hypothetical protein